MFDSLQNIFLLDIPEKSQRGKKKNSEANAKRSIEPANAKNWHTSA